jgi:hypothetical protein
VIHAGNIAGTRWEQINEAFRRWTTPLRRRSTNSPLGPLQARELAEGLRDEREALLALSSEMGAEFVGLVGELRKISRAADAVRDRSGQVMAVTSGQSESSAIHFSFQLLKKAEDLVKASYEQYEHVFAVFGELARGLASVTRQREQLMHTLLPLAMITTQFRIQACSFDRAVRKQFLNLAGEIGTLLVEVRTAVERRFEDLGKAKRISSELLEELSERVAQHQTRIESSLGESRSQLRMLNESFETSDQAAKSLSDASLKVGEHVTKIVVALQCEDMARQKIEHLCEAIGEMVAHLEPGPGLAPSTVAEPIARRFVSAAALIQREQLEALFAQLDEAAQAVAGGLEGIEASTGEIADRALQAGRTAVDGQVVSKSIQGMREILSIVELTLGQTDGIMQSFGPLRSKLTDCTEKITELALRLRMGAVNAQVYAAQVVCGGALEVLADQTRAVCDRSRLELEQISGAIARLSDKVENLEQRLGDFQQLGRAERRFLAEEAEISERKLHKTQRELAVGLTEIDPVRCDLTALTRHTRDSLRFPAELGLARARSIGFFTDLSERLSVPEEGANGLNGHETVERLRRNYTMAHEREIHERASGDTGGLPTASLIRAQPDLEPGLVFETAQGQCALPEQQEVRPDTGDLGGNVELF